MPRLTEVQRGQAIALLMQGQRQQQVALQFGVNVSTIERLVHCLRDTGRVADRTRQGCPCATTLRQDRAIRLAHLRNRHVTATETALTTVGNHNRHIHPKTEKPVAILSTLHWFSSHSCTLCASYGLVGSTWSQTISNEAMETGLFHR